jgi:hypothetical protein
MDTKSNVEADKINVPKWLLKKFLNVDVFILRAKTETNI